MLRKVAELRRAVGWPAMTAATVLLSLTALCMLALTLATWQPDNNPRWVLYVLVVVALGGLAWTVRRGALLEPREVAAMVSLCFVALAVLTWGTERQVAVLANGTSTPTLAVFAVWFLRGCGSTGSPAPTSSPARSTGGACRPWSTRSWSGAAGWGRR